MIYSYLVTNHQSPPVRNSEPMKLRLDRQPVNIVKYLKAYKFKYRVRITPFIKLSI